MPRSALCTWSVPERSPSKMQATLPEMQRRELITRLPPSDLDRKLTQSRSHRLGLTPQLANPRLRDNQGLSPACVASSSVYLIAHLTRDMTSLR